MRGPTAIQRMQKTSSCWSHKNKLQHGFKRRTIDQCAYAQYFYGSFLLHRQFSFHFLMNFLGQVVGETYANKKHRQTLRIRLQNAPICQKLLRVSPWNSLQTLNLVLCTFRSCGVSVGARISCAGWGFGIKLTSESFDFSGATTFHN